METEVALTPKLRLNRKNLESIYQKYNHREFVHPDPLEFLYSYPDIRDREIVGLIASGLAYGRVAQILKSVSSVLEKMGPSPLDFLKESRKGGLERDFRSFKHRFTTSQDLVEFLMAVKKVISKEGSLQGAFLKHYREKHDSVLDGLCEFVGEFLKSGLDPKNSLIASPVDGSACKRLNLFMRWMVRKDAVDPGGWDEVSASKLIVPLDVHMHRICTRLGFTKRKQADLKTAIEVTGIFKRFDPIDPVKYDFSITRFGIRDDMDYEPLFKSFNVV